MTNFWRHITRKNIRMLRNEEKGQGIIAPVFYFIGKTVPLYKTKVGIEMETKK